MLTGRLKTPMRPARRTHTTAARRLLALALGLWLSGAGCLACCEGTALAAAHGGAHDSSGPRDADGLLDAIRAAERATTPPPAASMSADHSCCKARVGAAARDEAAAVAADAPRPARAGERPAPGGAEARRETLPGRACCRRILQTAEQPRRDRFEPAPPQAAAPTAAPLPSPAAARRLSFAAARPRAPDRGGTYLLCRALLI